MTELLELKSSVQRALLGEVVDDLVAVTAGRSGNNIKLACYYSGEITADKIERTSVIGAEVVADFPEANIEEITLDVETQPLRTLQFWAYLKAGHPKIES